MAMDVPFQLIVIIIFQIDCYLGGIGRKETANAAIPGANTTGRNKAPFVGAIYCLYQVGAAYQWMQGRFGIDMAGAIFFATAAYGQDEQGQWKGAKHAREFHSGT